MKKIIFASIMLTGVSFSLYSQIQKGDFALGLNSSIYIFNTTKTPEYYSGSNGHVIDSKQMNLGYFFGPELRYFISNRFSIGASIHYEGGKSTDNYNYGSNNLKPYRNDVSTSKNKGLYSSIHLNYYIPTGEKAAFSIQAAPRIGFSKKEDNRSIVFLNNYQYSNETSMSSTKSSSYGGSISPAFIFFLYINGA